MREAVIVEAVRSPVGRKKGKLANYHPVDLGAHALKALVKKAKIDPKEIDDVYFGCVSQAGAQALNIGRNCVLAAGFPIDVPATTMDRQCGSSLTAINSAAMSIMAGVNECAIGAGAESMDMVPMGSNFMNGPGMPGTPELMEKYPVTSQHNSAEMLAKKWGITRQEADEFSLRSHQRAAKAIKEGRFKSQIATMELKKEDGTTEIFDTDEGVRADTSMEKLSSLMPVTGPEGLVTAGNASQISDGAGAVLIMSSEKAKKLGLKPRARIVAMDVVGDDPVMMLSGPIPATRKILQKAGLRITDIDVTEINEAFAVVPIAWGKEIKPNWEKVNPNGGAVALGHPLGATGAILVTKTLYELERTGGRYGMITLCTGGGMAPITIIERLDGKS
ncbi:MAG TPA: thiolase family protein [bacterium]